REKERNERDDVALAGVDERDAEREDAGGDERQLTCAPCDRIARTRRETEYDRYEQQRVHHPERVGDLMREEAGVRSQERGWMPRREGEKPASCDAVP